MLVDFVVSGDRNVAMKEAKKILKYKDFVTEMHRAWNVETRLIPVIIQESGII